MSAVITNCLDGVKSDQLDGTDLKDGGLVRLVWPDGTEDDTVYVIEMDIRRHGRDRLAYVVAPIRGTTNRLYLRWQPTIDVVRVLGS